MCVIVTVRDGYIVIYYFLYFIKKPYINVICRGLLFGRRTFSTGGTSDGITETAVIYEHVLFVVMDSDEKKLETKLKQLNIKVQRTKQVLDSGKTESIRRQLQALQETVRETNNSKRAAEAAKIKIDKDEGIDIINNWSDEVEAKLERLTPKLRDFKNGSRIRNVRTKS